VQKKIIDIIYLEKKELLEIGELMEMILKPMVYIVQ
jgi:hypothetical protein